VDNIIDSGSGVVIGEHSCGTDGNCMDDNKERVL
jgi:hypothetical protein